MKLPKGLGRIALLMATVSLVALPVAAATSPRDDLDDIRGQVADLSDMLEGRNNLNRREVASLRQDLQEIGQDLDDLRDRIGGGGGGGNGGGGGGHYPEPPGHDWQRFNGADVDVWPSYAAFDGWRRNRRFVAEASDSEHSLTFSVDNADYTADWTFENVFSGNPKVTVDPREDGDLYLTVRDNRGSRQFLIKNGGIGPIFARAGGGGGGGGGGSHPPDSDGGSMAWLAPYEDLVRAGQLDRSAGMEWFTGQVEDDRYSTEALAGLGRYLRFQLPENVRGEIATLRYTQNGSRKLVPVSDPRNSVSSFVYAIDKAYDLYRNGTQFAFDLK